jgi:5-formyltetrahydrofolate cyclo-ligase
MEHTQPAPALLDKTDSRRSLQAALRATLPEARAGWSAAMRGLLLGSSLWQQARTVMLFAALKYEPELVPLIGSGTGRRLVFPSMEHDRIVPRAVARAEDFALSPGGIREPAGGPIVDAEEIDLIFVPGLGFTPGGVRLGRGRGHYDQFLPCLRAGVARVGTAFSCQVRDSLPSEPFDVPMTALLTESGLRPVPAVLRA